MNYPTASFEVRPQEYHDLQVGGKAILRGRWLLNETGAVVKRLVTLMHGDDLFVCRVLNVRLTGGRADVEVELLTNET